jgi:hypothetical protein
MCVKRNLLVAGGFQGEMVCKVRWLGPADRSVITPRQYAVYCWAPTMIVWRTCAPETGTNHVLCVFEQNLDRPGVSYCAKITHDDNAITNAIDIYDNCRYLCEVQWVVCRDYVQDPSSVILFRG